jgi:hypothetical protein
MERIKLAVVIPTHCDAFILKLTLGTLLRHFQQHDLNIQLGLHKSFNVGDVSKGFLDQLRRVAQVHLVDEINWVEHHANLARYSLMHAKNIESLFQQIKYYRFDYVLILDNDVQVKADFLTELVTRFPEADLLGTYFREPEVAEEFTNGRDHETMLSIPRVAPWHLLLSRRLYAKIMENPSVLYPVIIRDEGLRRERQRLHGVEKDLPIFSDTFGEVLHHCKQDWDMKLGIVSNAEFSQWAHHFFCSSLNYGRWALGEQMPAHLARIKEIYDTEFPNGLEF